MPDIFTKPPTSKPTLAPEETKQELKTVLEQEAKQTEQAPQPEKKSQPLILQTEDQTKSVEEAPIKVTQYPAGSSVGLFSSFRMHPKGLKFVNQEDGEHIILFIRRHFIVNFPWVALTVVFSLLPVLVFALINVSGLTLFNIPPQLVVIMVIFYYLVIFNYALMNFIIWFYHVGIVTPKRLLDLDVYNILSHHLAETEIADVVDVSYAQKGFFQSFFNFGDVPIQTQAIKANFEFEASPRPAEVSDIITDLRPHRPHPPKPGKGGGAHA